MDLKTSSEKMSAILPPPQCVKYNVEWEEQIPPTTKSSLVSLYERYHTKRAIIVRVFIIFRESSRRVK